MTFRTIGGVLDFFIYSGPTPEDVMKAHWSVVGRPAAPPFWALGFHLCRWGYSTDKDLNGQIHKMRSGLIGGYHLETVLALFLPYVLK